MHKAPTSADINLSDYAPGANSPTTFYGLPQEIKFCQSCVISNQRPNSAVEFKHTKDSKKATISFSEDGVCDACKVAEQKHGTTDPVEMERLADALTDDEVAGRWIVTDDPDEVVEAVRPYVDWGFDHLVVHAPGHDQGRFLTSFAERVLPRLRELG